MPVKWTKPKKAAGTEARKPESKPKADKKPNGKKGAK